VRLGTVCLLLMVLTGCGGQRPGGDITAGSPVNDTLESWRRDLIRGQTDPVAEPRVDTRREGAISYAKQPQRRAMIFAGGSPIRKGEGRVNLVRGGTVEVDLDEIDIRDAAKAVLGDVLRVGYSVDPNVSGTVTLKTAGPKPVRDVLALFENALQQNNAALAMRNGTYIVMPATTGGLEAANGISAAEKGGVGYQSRAVPLRHIAAREMAEILKPYAKEGITRIDPERNLLVLSGSGAQFDSWMETIRTFDVDWLANKSVGVFPIESMSANEMIRHLSDVLANANSDDRLAQFSVLDSNNAVLVIARTPSALQTVRRWVSRLDAAGRSGVQLFTYEMRHARAQDVAPVVANVLGASTTPPAGEGASSNGAAPTAATAGADAKPAMQNQPASPSMTSETGTGQPSVADVAQFGGFARFSDSQQAGQPRRMRIVPNVASNTLLIYATAQEFEQVRDILRSIDVPQRQVLVEATIIEVTLNDELKYGVQYFLDKLINGTEVVGALSNTENLVPNPSSPGFSLSLGLSTRAVVDALSGVTSINVVSSPNLMVLNNQTARLVVGDQVPIATQSRQNALEQDQVTVNTIEFRDTGVIFDVTPRINSAGSVTLNIVQEVSSVARQAQQTLTPTISQRKIESAVTAGHGETIILGGLFSNSNTRTRAGLPGATRSSILSGLFGSTQSFKQKTELLILISPKIVSDKMDARRVTNEIRSRIKELQVNDPGRPLNDPSRPPSPLRRKN
jgi:general secretion pathway protein D